MIIEHSVAAASDLKTCTMVNCVNAPMFTRRKRTVNQSKFKSCVFSFKRTKEDQVTMKKNAFFSLLAKTLSDANQHFFIKFITTFYRLPYSPTPFYLNSPKGHSCETVDCNLSGVRSAFGNILTSVDTQLRLPFTRTHYNFCAEIYFHKRCECKILLAK